MMETGWHMEHKFTEVALTSPEWPPGGGWGWAHRKVPPPPPSLEASHGITLSPSPAAPHRESVGNQKTAPIGNAAWDTECSPNGAPGVVGCCVSRPDTSRDVLNPPPASQSGEKDAGGQWQGVRPPLVTVALLGVLGDQWQPGHRGRHEGRPKEHLRGGGGD